MNHARTIPLALLLFGLATPAVAADIDVLASATLGDELGGQPVALDLFDDGTVVLAGSDDRGGTLVRLDAAGVAVDAVTRLASAVEDVAVDRRSGSVAVVTRTELAVLDAELAVVWRTALAPAIADEHARRVAVGESGTIAVVAAGQLRTFSGDGDALGMTAVVGTTSSVAVLDGSDLVVTTGWTRACDDRLDVAALTGFDRAGTLRWRAYGDVADCESDGTRGVDVARGEDGSIYLLAEVDGARNPFSAAPATNVAFDALTRTDDLASSRFAYYARFTPAGEQVVGQFFAFADEDAIVQPAAIAADAHGTVVLTGTTTHTLAQDDDGIHSEALYAPAGWYQTIRADFGERLLWRSLEIDDTRTEARSLALAGSQVVTLLQASRLPSADDDTPAGPMVLTFPTDPQTDVPKRPDRDDVGTFGYESGVAGSDPTCYACGPTRAPTPAGVLALVVLVVVARPRRS